MSQWNWIDTLTRQFELCKAANDRDVVVVATTDTARDIVDTALIALQRTGARGSLLTVQSADLPASARAALVAADLIIDCTDLNLDAPAETHVLTIGVREAAGIERHVPHPGLRNRVEGGLVLLRNGSDVKLTSSGGSNLTMTLNGSEFAGSFGYPHPGRPHDSWPGGFVDVMPSVEDAAGQIVLMPGDVNVTLEEFIHSPVTLEVEAGRIREITGESGDADLLRAYLESFETPEAYRMSRVRLGLNSSLGSEDPFDRSQLTAGESTLRAGQLSLSFGEAEAGEPLFTVGLRTATLAIGSVTPLQNGQLRGELAPDVYETAAKQR